MASRVSAGMMPAWSTTGPVSAGNGGMAASSAKAAGTANETAAHNNAAERCFSGTSIERSELNLGRFLCGLLSTEILHHLLIAVEHGTVPAARDGSELGVVVLHRQDVVAA